MGGSACSKLERAPGNDLLYGSNGENSVNGEENDMEDEFDLLMEDSSSATGASAVGDDYALETFTDRANEVDETANRLSLTRTKGARCSFEEDPSKVFAIEDRGRHPEGVFDFSELTRPYAVFKEGLFANPHIDVKVTVGPVVGKVTDTSAIILLEVDSHVQVSLNFAAVYEPIDSSTHQGHNFGACWPKATSLLAGMDLETALFCAEGSCTLCHIMKPGRPSTFEVWGLRPATSYLVLLSNVSADEMTNRIARFRTFPRNVQRFRVAAVCGNRLPDEHLGIDCPWQSFFDFVCKGPDVDVVVQVGLTVDADAAMAKAKGLLLEYSSYQEGVRMDMEEKARESFRAAFRKGWGFEASVVASLAGIGSHLSVFAPPCQLEKILQALTDCEDDSWKTDEWRAALRASIDVYYEYQRALWQESTNMTKAKREARLEQDDNYDNGQLPDEFLHKAKPASKGLVEEWHYHKYGSIGIFMFDTKGGRLRADGTLTSSVGSSHDTHPLLQSSQWNALKEVMQDESLQVLLLVSDLPFFSEDVAIADKTIDGSREPPRKKSPKDSSRVTSNDATNKPDAPLRPRRYPHGSFFDWCSRPNEICRLLARAFEWKYDKYPHRDVVLLSGGRYCGTFGDVCDHELGLSIPVVVTGPLCDKVSVPKEWALCGSLAEGRFSYVYRTPLKQCNFCIVDIDLGQGLQKPSVDVQLVSTPLADRVAFPEVQPIPELQQAQQAVSRQSETYESEVIPNYESVCSAHLYYASQ